MNPPSNPPMNRPRYQKHQDMVNKLRTYPAGWDLSSLLPEQGLAREQASQADDQSQSENAIEQEVRMRADWQLDPHFDRDEPDPSRPDLSAF